LANKKRKVVRRPVYIIHEQELRIVMMVNSIMIRFVISAVAIITFLSLVTSVGHSQAFPFVSHVTAIVFDQSGAVIPDSELVFRSNDSKEIVSHTGADGSVTVSLQNGRYSVAITKLGFVKTEVRDVQVPMSEALRVVMKVAPTGPTIFDVGPTTNTSDLPNAIAPETSRVPTAHPVKKSRSWQCLYLWKCSAS
jgi:carboxypeptidase family protein